MPHQEIPYWCSNIAHNEWPKTCPEYLVNLSDKDRGIIGRPESTFRRMTWKEVTNIINTNQLAKFERSPIELRKYLQYIHNVKKQHGSIMNFVLKHRLKWTSTVPKGRPFEHPDDIKVLFNDWPYGIDERIVHLVVWTKFPFEEDPDTGDLTWEGRIEIEDYIERTFGRYMKPGHVAWFKNWSALKSIHALEHFHVMLFNPSPSLIEEVTNGDMPMIAKVTLV